MSRITKTPGDSSWFVQDRFGMFIHWGLYAMPARHEWVMNREAISQSVYESKYFQNFNPDRFDPTSWAIAAREAGMKYFVITTKHHDGFCLWDTKQTDYKVTNTPYGKDLIGPMVEAFRAENIRVGFYHSLLDWHHPEFPIDVWHPMKDNPDAETINRQRDVRKYAAYLHAQVEELMTWFGKIDILWFDYSYSGQDDETRGFKGKGKKDWQSRKLINICRKHQPHILINNRTEIPQDLITPEQIQPREWVKVDGKPVVWEACHTFSGSWGYHRDEMTWKSASQLIQLLIDSVSCGGNLLMNVGPNARGELDCRATNALRAYSDWISLHGRAIYGCTASRFAAPRDCRLTQNGKKLYLHIYNWPFRYIYFDGMAGKIGYAQFLHDGSEVHVHEDEKTLIWDSAAKRKKTVLLEIPVVKPNVEVPVIEILLR